MLSYSKAVRCVCPGDKWFGLGVGLANINSSTLGRYRSKDVDMNLPVYTAARQAARTAWRMIERKCGGREDPATNNAHLKL